MWKRNLTHTHTLPGFVDTYLLLLALSHRDGGVVLPAGRVLRPCRATGDRFDGGDGSLSLSTWTNAVWDTWPSGLSLCVCVFVHACLHTSLHLCRTCVLCELWTRAVGSGRAVGLSPQMGQNERCQSWTGDAWLKLDLNGRRVGCGMSHPDSYGHSLTQPEKIFHTLNSFHSIKLSITLICRSKTAQNVWCSSADIPRNLTGDRLRLHVCSVFPVANTSEC